MASGTRRPIPLLLAACAAQFAVVSIGVWLLVSDRRRDADTQARDASILAMANLHASLTDAERVILFAVIQGERLHPDLPKSFQACLERARQECRVARAHTAFPGEAEEVEQLAAQLEEVARRGDGVLAAPAGERLSRYDTPGTGFQAAATKAWQHLCTVRALSMVGLENAYSAGRGADRRAAGGVIGLGVLSLLLTAVVAWRQLCGARRAEPSATPDPT